MSRVPFVCGNWKMHKTVEETVELADALVGQAKDLAGVEVGIAPPFTSLHAAHNRLSNSKIRLAAQNVHFESQGAYTGEISVAMLASVGCQYGIVGHSERRQLFGETDEGCAKKVGALLKGNLGVILCVGETLDQREANQHFEVVARQVKAGLSEVTGEPGSELVIAYEPVWAIGTGKTATPTQAQEMHAKIRGMLKDRWPSHADGIRLQYGGSVKPDNARDLFSQPDIDGGLIGGAALKVDSFTAILRAAQA